MAEIVRSPSSILDYEDIWHYVAVDDPKAADRLILKLEQKLSLLAAMPTMGRDEAASRAGLRSFPVGNYILFYREISDGIELVRALHGARDITPEFFSEP